MVGARGRREPLFSALRLSAAFCAILSGRRRGRRFRRQRRLAGLGQHRLATRRASH